MGNFPLFPEQASTFATRIDQLYFVLIALSLLFAGTLPFVILFLIVRYHRSTQADRSNAIDTSLKLELTWSIIPLILALGVFFWAAYLYIDMRHFPDKTLDVYVIGKQWMWHTQHPNGKRENNELHVPVGKPVKLIMTSQDVIHSFYIPAFRVKQDVVPGRYTSMWFEATKPGEYHLFCAEYCGTDHSVMGGRVVVMPLADYERWLTTSGPIILPDDNTGASDGSSTQNMAGSSSATTQGTTDSLSDPMASAGQQLFASAGCTSCHQGGGVGPNLAGVYGTEQMLEGGQTVTADENYLRESILNPQAKIVAGYPPVMPPYEGQLSEDEVLQLIAYMKSLSDNASSGN